ncbi:Hypothetical protein LUCI_4717 [Lucifera butyrica]|uniref:DUF2922 domain-containing protein n=1 Tax=Lucifera butyrica TaxID=1351585 RepID=A0A498REQ9_9FIRM|nr:DUF2922 domain-containing protein [Lucifera butyrica]VBB09427.1 Hypothetical protein LUCI_4717 [Lucifera butyrica]
MTKTLEMVFRNSEGKQVTLSVAEPRENLTLAEVQAVMNDIVGKNIFLTTGGDLKEAVDARIRTRDVIALV